MSSIYGRKIYSEINVGTNDSPSLVPESCGQVARNESPTHTLHVPQGSSSLQKVQARVENVLGFGCHLPCLSVINKNVYL